MKENKPAVLIVEDDLSSQQYYKIILEDLYELAIVSTVLDAIDRIKQQEFRIALIDISLPGEKNGIDLLKYLDAQEGKVPVGIAVTAHAFPHTRVDALEAGAVEFFTKPIMSEALIEAIEHHLKA